MIAWYGRKIPPQLPSPHPDIPLPQSFCPRCRYNLHGQQTGRCSECGQVLLMNGN
jgi:uncharacterized paraquat-inducible protein A